MGARILIVDDDQSYVEAIQEWLAIVGYDPIAANTFEEAKRAIRDKQPDLLIVDIRLGPFNGLQLIAAPDVIIPAIILTGFDDPVLRREALAAGAAAYLLKPVVLDQLSALIEQQLACARPTTEAATTRHS